MSKQDDFNAILDYFYLGGQGTLAEKIKNAVSHELTCGDLSHMHGVTKVEWSQPDDKVRAKTKPFRKLATPKEGKEDK